MLKALIFDLDGVITDTEPIHMEAWLSVLEPIGISFDEDEYRTHYIGLNDRDFLGALSHIHGHHFDDGEKSRLTEEKMAANLRLLERGIPLLPGVEGFVTSNAKRYMLSICSGAMHREIEFILRRLKWTGLFDPVIPADLVKKGKPDPEGYIRALEGLSKRAKDFLPEEAIAIEDSPKGIMAAHRAGIRSIAVTNTFSPEELNAADRIVSNLTDLDLETL